MQSPVPVLLVAPILMQTRMLVMPRYSFRVDRPPAGKIIRPGRAERRRDRDGYWVALFRRGNPLRWIAKLCNRNPDQVRRRMLMWRMAEHLFPLPDDPPDELILPERGIQVEVNSAGRIVLIDGELCLILYWLWVEWTRAAVPIWGHVTIFNRVEGHIRRSMRRWEDVEYLPLGDVHARRLFLPQRAPQS